MRRFLTICMVLALVVLFASPASADWMSEKHPLRIVTVADATADGGTSVVATTTFIPGKDVVVGYSVSATSSETNVVIGLYDSAEGDMAAGTLFAESEDVNDSSVTVWFPYPKSIATQLAIGQGQNTVATVYYVRLNP